MQPTPSKHYSVLEERKCKVIKSLSAVKSRLAAENLRKTFVSSNTWGLRGDKVFITTVQAYHLAHDCVSTEGVLGQLRLALTMTDECTHSHTSIAD